MLGIGSIVLIGQKAMNLFILGNSASMTQGKKEFLILTTGLLMMVSRILL